MAEPNPNTNVMLNPMNQWDLDNRSTFANGAAGSVAPTQLWLAKLRWAMTTNDFWAKYRKAGASSPIKYEKRPGSAGGAIVNLRSAGQLGGAGKMGDQLFVTAADFGTIPLKEWPIYLDMVSQATGVSPHTEEMLGLKDEINNMIPDQLGAWGGQFICRNTDMTLMHRCAETSQGVINGKAVASLTLDDCITYDAIMGASSNMRDQGGQPFRAGHMENGEEMWNMAFPLPDPLALGVKRDPGYKSRISDAGIRGKDNVFFRGGIEAIDGNQILTRQIPTPQGKLAAGSVWAPIAYLGSANAYSAGSPVATLTGGGAFYDSNDTTTPWYQDFPGWAYVYNQVLTQTVATSLWGRLIGTSGPFYALIVNPPTAATDPNKVGMIAYTVGTNANTLTITSRLSSSSSTGINDTTTGSVTSSTGPFAVGADFTQEYAAGAAVIPCNSAGVPIGAFLGIGAEAIGFVRGDHWGERYTQKVSGGLHGQNSFAGWTFGQSPYLLPSGMTPAISVTICAIDYRYKYKVGNPR